MVFDGGALTFYKDGVATADQLSAGAPQQAAGTLQLGAGFGATTGFTGEIYDVRVWSVARTAGQIASWRWAPLSLAEPGLTARTSFDAATQQVVNQVGGAACSITAGQVITTELRRFRRARVVQRGAGGQRLPLTAARIDSSAATLECWMKMSAAAGVAAAGQTLAGGGGVGDLAPQFAYAGNDALSFSWHGISYRSADTRAVSDGAWHHVAVVFNQNYVTFYKDGVAAADVFQMPALQPSEGLLVIGGALGSMAAFNGELYDIRVWNTARTTAQISSFRYVTLTGDEPGLTALCNLSGMNPAQPGAPVNQVNQLLGTMGGRAAVVAAVLPQQPLPASVWTYPVSGESAGPLLSPQGLLCTHNAPAVPAGRSCGRWSWRPGRSGGATTSGRRAS